MTRKATDSVTTIGIDIGKNSLHLTGLEDRCGSSFPLTALTDPRPESGVKQSKSTRTSAYRRKAAVIGRHSGR